MALQRFDEFTGNKSATPAENDMDTQKVSRVESMPESPLKKIDPKVLKALKTTGKLPPPQFTNYKDAGPTAENIEVRFNGKIVKLPDNTKPSENYKLLESKNVSKDKLHYMVNKQNNNSILIVKYNEKADLKLKEFVEQLLEYYKKNNTLAEYLKNVIVEGNETYSIIKNIPNAEFKENYLIDVITEDLMKLLK